MFAADPKLLQRFEPHLRSVLIVDPQPASAKVLADLVRALGGKNLMVEPDEKTALSMARDFDPTMIFVEFSGPRLDGLAFTRKLRRSDMSCRRAPVIMVTAEATVQSIKGARDVGVHEFLRKPFTAGDLLKRLEAVALKPRDWIEAVGYVGPDRRRFNSAEYAGPRKRNADKPKTPGEAQAQAMDQAVRILRAAVAQFDNDPGQAIRALRQQAATLKQLAVEGSHVQLAVAAAQLDLAVARDRLTRADVEGPVAAVTQLFAANAPQARVA